VATRPPADDPVAKLADASRLRTWLKELLPDYTTSPEDLREMFREPTNIIRYEDTPAPAMCWVAVNLPTSDVQVVNLFPQTSGGMALVQPLLKACLIAAGQQYPRALDWPVWAQFQPGVANEGRRKTQTWRLVFPTAEIGVTGTGFAYIRMTRLRDAITVVETWLS